MEYVLTCIKKGERYLPEYKELTAWGGWTEKNDAADALYDMEAAGYPTRPTDWMKNEHVDAGLLTDTFWFCPPRELHDKLFGPKFNDYGEVSP